MKPTLLILAAGMGSRYQGNKQIDTFGPSQETIMDYSIYDAIRAGFGKVVFIIRKEHETVFSQLYGDKLKGKIDFDFAFQGLETYLPAKLDIGDRTKPWGTGHAMLCAWAQTATPFAVINADDFYGREAFEIMFKFLTENLNNHTHAMVGYKLANTLSENGSVSRGVCVTNAKNLLETVTERTKIYKKHSKIVFSENDLETELAEDTIVSMNFWGFKTSVFAETEKMFSKFASANAENIKSEFYIPLVMSTLIDENKGECQVFSNNSPWFGVTYPEDKASVVAEILKLVKENKYPTNLWA